MAKKTNGKVTFVPPRMNEIKNYKFALNFLKKIGTSKTFLSNEGKHQEMFSTYCATCQSVICLPCLQGSLFLDLYFVFFKTFLRNKTPNGLRKKLLLFFYSLAWKSD